MPVNNARIINDTRLFTETRDIKGHRFEMCWITGQRGVGVGGGGGLGGGGEPGISIGDRTKRIHFP
jgi:hypothetical protein